MRKPARAPAVRHAPNSFRSGRLSAIRAAALVTALVGAVGCGGAQFDGRVFRNDELSFAVPGVPSNWRRLEASETLLAFRDDAAHASIAVNGRCNKDGDDVPLEALTHHLFLQFTERTVTGQSRLMLSGREALRTDLTAKLDGVARSFSVVVLKKNGCVYDFVYVAPPDAADGARAQFMAFVEGFSTIRP